MKRQISFTGSYPEPEWTAENQNRKEGDTTFKQCGWCEFRGCGSYRYNCAIVTSCSLLESYANETHWDTACQIIKFGKKDLVDLLDSKKRKIVESESHIASIKKQIQKIKELHLKANPKPPLPNRRIHTYYNLNDVVYIFHNEEWNRGVVVSGYRHHDGCVSYVLDNFPESKKGWGCGTGVPCILKEWEFKYFQANLNDFYDWLELSNREYNGEFLPLEKYYEAMREGDDE